MLLFLDANTYLSFYHYTKDDLEGLGQLAVLAQNQHIVLVLPDQTADEVSRNREAKIKDALTQFKRADLSLELPRIATGYSKSNELRDQSRKSARIRDELIDSIRKDAMKGELAADRLIKRLFELAKLLRATPDDWVRAKDRMLRGNPPGKPGSHGDAIVWETLLAHVKDSTPLHFVSRDGDFASVLDLYGDRKSVV